MFYSFARVTVALGMRDYFEGRRGWFRLYEKGVNRQELPAYRNADTSLDGYLAAGIATERETPLVRAIDRCGMLIDGTMHRIDACRMVKQQPRQSACQTTFAAKRSGRQASPLVWRTAA